MGSESKYQVKTIQVKPKGQAEESKNESPPPKRKKKKISRENTRVFTNPDQMSIPKGSCVVNPKKTGKWDAVMVICLVFTAIVTPYEVAFLDMSVINALWFINQLVNILFLIDMFINFFLAYFDDEALQWVVSKRLIAIRYLSGWFIGPHLEHSFPRSDRLGSIQPRNDRRKIRCFRETHNEAV